jgi:hypothetical protein
MTHESDFFHLLALCRALRLAQRGDLSCDLKPDPASAQRLSSALDVFIATHTRELEKP